MCTKRPRWNVSTKRRIEQPQATVSNESWSMDFMSDQLFCGHRIRLFTLVDNYMRESLALEVAQRFRGEDVAKMLEQVCRQRVVPRSIRMDNGPEFTLKASVGVHKQGGVEFQPPWEAHR